MKPPHRDFLSVLRADLEDYEGGYDRVVPHVPRYFELLTGLLDDARFPKDLRPMVNCALAYFIVPFDVLSEEDAGPDRYVDEAFVCAKAVDQIGIRIPNRQIVLDHWSGKEDPFDLSRSICREVMVELGEEAIEQILHYTGIEEV